MRDKAFLTWIKDRLHQVHGEKPNVDYMLKFQSIIDNMDSNTCTPNVMNMQPKHKQHELTVTKIVCSVLETTLGLPEGSVKPDTIKDDLTMDFLDEIEFIMKLEEVFGMEISDEQAEKFKTVQDIVDYVSSEIRVGGGGK